MVWLLVIIALTLTAFGATAGAALVAESRSELAAVVRHRLRGSRRPLTRLGRIDSLLTAASATTSMGIVMLGGIVPAALAGSDLIVVAVLALLLAIPTVLFGGYLFPRLLTRPRASAVARWVTPLLTAWSAPLRWLLPVRAPREPSDLRSLWREGAAVGLDSTAGLDEVGGLVRFSKRPVREVMTPRTDMVAIAEDADLADIRKTFAESGYSRLPVYRGTMDEIIGMVHAFDLLKLHPGQPLPVRPVAVAPASRLAGDLLLDMQRERRHLAIVLDEFGGTQGMATLEDLLEELVGEIFDEHDEEVRSVAAEGPTVIEVAGAMTPEELEEKLSIPLPQTQAQTVGGMLVELAGRIPRKGERFRLGDLEIDVLDASPTALKRLLVRHGHARTQLLKPELPE